MSSTLLPTVPTTDDIDNLMKLLTEAFNVERPMNKPGQQPKANAADFSTLIKAFFAFVRGSTTKIEKLQLELQSETERIDVLEHRLIEREKEIARLNGIISPVSSAVPPPPTTLVNAVAADVRQRQKRESNVVIFGIPSPKSENDDKEFTQELFRKLCSSDKKIVKIHRFKAKASSLREPPVVVELNSKVDRDEILKNAKSLKNETSSKFAKVYINPDLTYVQRMEAKRVREEKKKSYANKKRSQTQPSAPPQTPESKDTNATANNEDISLLSHQTHLPVNGTISVGASVNGDNAGGTNSGVSATNGDIIDA